MPGRYRLAWDLVQEHRLWFSTEERIDVRTQVVVEGPPTAGRLTPQTLPDLRFRLGRIELWSMAGRMLLAQPLLGVGPDNFRLLYDDHMGLETADYSLHSNNMYLEFLVGGGLLTGVLFLWFSAAILGGLRKSWQKLEDWDLPLAAGVTAAAIGIATHGLVDHFLGFTPTYVMIWTVWGLVGALRQEGRTETDG